MYITVYYCILQSYCLLCCACCCSSCPGCPGCCLLAAAFWLLSGWCLAACWLLWLLPSGCCLADVWQPYGSSGCWLAVWLLWWRHRTALFMVSNTALTNNNCRNCRRATYNWLKCCSIFSSSGLIGSSACSSSASLSTQSHTHSLIHSLSHSLNQAHIQ